MSGKVTAYQNGLDYMRIRGYAQDDLEAFLEDSKRGKLNYKTTKCQKDFVKGLEDMYHIILEERAEKEADSLDAENTDKLQEIAADDSHCETYKIKYWVGDTVYTHLENAYSEDEARKRFRVMHPDNTIISVECLLKKASHLTCTSTDTLSETSEEEEQVVKINCCSSDEKNIPHVHVLEYVGINNKLVTEEVMTSTCEEAWSHAENTTIENCTFVNVSCRHMLQGAKPKHTYMNIPALSCEPVETERIVCFDTESPKPEEKTTMTTFDVILNDAYQGEIQGRRPQDAIDTAIAKLAERGGDIHQIEKAKVSYDSGHGFDKTYYYYVNMDRQGIIHYKQVW